MAKKKKQKQKWKYDIGDIVGVCSDRMYEFEIFGYNENAGCYNAKCVASADKKNKGLIKIGDLRSVRPDQIVVRLGSNGKKWPPPEFILVPDQVLKEKTQKKPIKKRTKKK